jgi:hypothetical protein
VVYENTECDHGTVEGGLDVGRDSFGFGEETFDTCGSGLAEFRLEFGGGEVSGDEIEELGDG